MLSHVAINLLLQPYGFGGDNSKPCNSNGLSPSTPDFHMRRFTDGEKASHSAKGLGVSNVDTFTPVHSGHQKHDNVGSSLFLILTIV